MSEPDFFFLWGPEFPPQRKSPFTQLKMPSPKGSVGARWCFTLNNYTYQEYSDIKGLACKYLIVGKEVAPTTDTPHLQGYVVFPTRKTLGALKKLSARAHWEIAKGTSDENYEYCSKGGDFAEVGTRPETRAQKSADASARQKARWRAVIESARAGTCEEEFPGEFIRYNGVVRRLYNPPLSDIPEYSGVWYHGPPGRGKSRTARLDFPGAYDKLINKWWDNYEDEVSVLVDDLSMDHGFMGSFLKRWADHYPFRAEYKGGSKMIRPKNIVITSNYTPSEIWTQDSMLVEAIERRFKLVLIE